MTSLPSLSRVAKAILKGGFSDVFVDADDTLWHDSKYFRDFRKMFVQACHAELIEVSSAEAALGHALRRVGLGEREFANAVLQAANDLNLCEATKRNLTAAKDGFLAHPLELLPNVVETLELLCTVNLQLITKGVLAEQVGKLERSGLQGFFSNVIVVDRKERSTLSDLFLRQNLMPDRVVSIGNSVLHDVIPAVTAGATAVWLDHADNDRGRNALPPETAHRVESWAQLRAALIEPEIVVNSNSTGSAH